jgi:segregation and condensation protein B
MFFMTIQAKLESVLFVASKPLSLKKIAKVLEVSEEEIVFVLSELRLKYTSESGIVILENNGDYQMVSNPENKEIAENFIKAEVSGELTRAQLETLTVISYCGPISKPELEQLRGVNCGLIIRNLMMRGLVKEASDSSELLPCYEVTMDYLRHLGINSLGELPDYEQLHKHEHIVGLLGKQNEIE